MRLQAVILGHDVRSDRVEVERIAYNYVFAEAGLSWHWDAQQFASLRAQLAGHDPLRCYARDILPPRCWTDDLAIMLRAVERRHDSVCRDFLVGGACRDSRIDAVVRAAIAHGLDVVTLARSPGAWADRTEAGSQVAQDHARALTLLQLPPAAVLAVEAESAGLAAAYRAGITTVMKAACLDLVSGHDAVAGLIAAHQGHSRASPATRRQPSPASDQEERICL